MFYFILTAREVHSSEMQTAHDRQILWAGADFEAFCRCNFRLWSFGSKNSETRFLVVATCDRLTVVISTSHVWNLLRTEGVQLHTPALQTGTHFLLTLETTVFLFHLLGAISKLFSSLSTRLAHAARLGFFFLQKRAI